MDRQHSPKSRIWSAFLKPVTRTKAYREGSRVSSHRKAKELRDCPFSAPKREPIRVRRVLAPCPLPDGQNKELLEDARKQSDSRLRARMRFQAAIRIVIEQQRIRKRTDGLPDGRSGATNVLLANIGDNATEDSCEEEPSCFEFFHIKARIQQLSDKFSPQAISPEKLLALRREFDEADSKRRYVTNV